MDTQLIGNNLLHYEVVKPLGAGGMGVVYEARDTHLDRMVAIKVLPQDKVASPERRARFVFEAKAASALNHPNIIAIHDITRDQGVDFIVMELVRGRTLDHVIPRKGMRTVQVLRYAIQIADALSKAHEASIIHRDLKPANVMISEDDRVKVLDFGLAKLTDAAAIGENDTTIGADAAPATEQGAILGTVAYMSPEQAEGRVVDARSDIFSFGAVLYEMLSGRRAFQGESSASTLAAVLEKEPRPIDGIPRDLERVVTRCLRKDPAKRFQTVADLKVVLEELKEESDSGKLDAPTGPQPGVSAIPWWGIAAAVVGVSLLAVALLWSGRRAPVTLPTAVPVPVPVTSYPGAELTPTLSPDATQVAFSWTGAGGTNSDIYVRLISGGDPLRLTSDPASDLSPRWSPDGSRIAFLRMERAAVLGLTDIPTRAEPSRRFSLMTVSPLGGNERKLCDVATDGAGISWSPDGGAIAHSDVDPETRGLSLFSLVVTTGERKQLTKASAFAIDVSPAWSPDGKWIVFVRNLTVGGAMELHRVPATGGEAERITHDEAWLSGVAWTPDGKELLYASTLSGDYTLWRLKWPVGQEPAHRVAGVEPVAVSPVVGGTPGKPTRLVYARGGVDDNIWLGKTGAAPRVVARSTRRDWSPQLSPNGTRIAFSSTRSGKWAVYVSDLDGKQVSIVADLPNTVVDSPRWSPDGRWIVFAGLERANRDIWIVGADAAGLRRLTSEPSEEGRPAFSADGKWVYFRSDRSGPQEIWKMPSAGGAAQQLTRNGGFEAYESWDGQRMLYVKSRLDLGLWSMPVAGGAETSVLQGVRAGGWAVAENGIVYVDWSEGGRSRGMPIRFATFDGAVSERVLTRGALSATAPYLGASRDASAIVWAELDELEIDVEMIDDFR